ncbi:MAG TPA: ATP-binding protein, partial [Thermomonospora sp.]|nr:ATP-binding protein [Thermomonospora sp.]
DMGDIDLVASEIVTNAVTHSASGGPDGRLLVSVLVARDRVRLEFTDDGGAFTRPGIPPCPDEGGRGLLIVSGLADMWGWDVGGDGRLTVWAELLRGVGQADVRR